MRIATNAPAMGTTMTTTTTMTKVSEFVRALAHFTMVIDEDETNGEATDGERDDDKEDNEIVALIAGLLVGRRMIDVENSRAERPVSSAVQRPTTLLNVHLMSLDVPPKEGECIAKVLLTRAYLRPPVPLQRAVLQRFRFVRGT